MITTNDFSDSTLELYYKAKKGEIAVSDFVRVLLDSDFPKKEVLAFVKINFRPMYKYIKSYMF